MMSKNKLIIIGLLGVLTSSLRAAPVEEPTRLFNLDEERRYFGGECHETEKVDLLYAKKLKANSIDACKINAQQSCAECMKSKYISTEKLGVRCEACIRKLKAENIHTDVLEVECDARIKRLITESLCVPMITTQDLCVTGTTINKEVCQKYKATLVFDTNTTYTLGGIVDWNTILSDPNHNVSLSPFTSYTAPVSGEYIIAIELNQEDLTGPTIIAGTPVANIQIQVNGVTYRETFVPFLSFHTSANAFVDSLIHLYAGDVVTTVFNVLVMSDTGFTSYPGEVIVLGDGTEQHAVWKIHYLSSDCLGVQCVPCTPPPSPKPCKPVCSPCPPPPAAACNPCDRWGDEFSWLR
jgi:hypothetical protein